MHTRRLVDEQREHALADLALAVEVRLKGLLGDREEKVRGGHMGGGSKTWPSLARSPRVGHQGLEPSMQQVRRAEVQVADAMLWVFVSLALAEPLHNRVVGTRCVRALRC